MFVDESVMERSMKRAVIDIGTNSVLMLIAEPQADGSLKALQDQAKTARLGEGLATTGLLSEAAMARTLAILRGYRQKIQAEDISDIICFGTAALRRASNAQDFITQVQQQLSLNIQVLSGEEEAHYTFAGAMSASQADQAVAIDIGGGSTEVVYGSRTQGISFQQSFPVGAVTLKEQLSLASQISVAERDRALTHLQSQFKNLQPAHNASVLFTGGTATTLPALEKRLTSYDIAQIEGTELSPVQIQHLYDRLNGMEVEARSQLPAMEPGRADIILPALLILQALLRQLWPDTWSTDPTPASLLCTVRGARYGILLDPTKDQ